MKQTGRLLAILLALIFIASSLLKALSFESFLVQIRYYDIVTSMVLVKVIGFCVVGVEALLGLCLFFYRRTAAWVLLAMVVLLLFFSALIAYAWAFRGLADCGCFGKYIQMTPAMSLGKNFVLFVFAVFAWWYAYRSSERGRVDVWRNAPSRNQGLGPHVVRGLGFSRLGKRGGAWRLVLAFSVFVAIMSCAYHRSTVAKKGLAQYTVEWNGEKIDLSSGMYLVAMISDSCSECAEIVASLNELCTDEELPQIVSFVLGEQDTLSSFREKYKPAFPTQLLPSMEFLEYIGKAPPRFILLENGEQLRFWDNKAPEALTVAEAMLEAF